MEKNSAGINQTCKFSFLVYLHVSRVKVRDPSPSDSCSVQTFLNLDKGIAFKKNMGNVRLKPITN